MEVLSDLYKIGEEYYADRYTYYSRLIKRSHQAIDQDNNQVVAYGRADKTIMYKKRNKDFYQENQKGKNEILQVKFKHPAKIGSRVGISNGATYFDTVCDRYLHH